MRRPARGAPRPPRTHRHRKPARREHPAPDRVTVPAQPPPAARTPKQAVTEKRLDAGRAVAYREQWCLQAPSRPSPDFGKKVTGRAVPYPTRSRCRRTPPRRNQNHHENHAHHQRRNQPADAHPERRLTLSRAAEATSLTRADLVIGSPGFMSPEQAEGGQVGLASDVFSLGAVLTFAATGQGPFGTGSTAALVYRVVHGSPGLGAVPPEVRPLIERCLVKDPGQRPTTAELLAELDGTDLAAGWLPAPIATQLSWHAEPPDTDDPAYRAAAEPGPLTAPPGSGLPTVTAARAVQGPTPSPQPAGPSPDARNRRRRPRLAALAAAGIVAVAAAGTAAGLHLAGGEPSASQRPGVPRASDRRSSATGPASPAGSPAAVTSPAAPAGVTATALNPHTIQITWTDNMTGVAGFDISNGCGTDGCSGGALNVRTGPVTSADITTTPGAYQCFYVTALNNAGASTSPHPGCTSTPGINIPTTQEWTDTGVTVPAGADLGISATGDAYLSGAGSSQGPAGDPSCTPAADYAAHSSRFPAPHLPCWSLIARIGNGRPFEVGTSILVTATAGKLYLGVNTDSFSANSGIWAVKIKVGGLP
jgi:hypothetical protein